MQILFPFGRKAAVHRLKWRWMFVFWNMTMSDLASMTSVRLPLLRAWVQRLLVKKGMYAAEADIAALRLIESDLLGRPGGGLRWLPRLLSALDLGDIDPRAELVALVDLPALAVIDGGTGVGQVALVHALHLAMKKASAVGSGTVVVKNSRPVGDPTACLASATSTGCVAGILTTCKRESEPWPIGPCTVWGWPGTDSPLATSAEPPAMDADLLADVLVAGLAGTKPAVRKKRLFADDAEYICCAIDVSKCTERDQFVGVANVAIGVNGLTAPAWIFDSAKWPEIAEIRTEVVGELRELATSEKIPAEWQIEPAP
jgi:hypothetical protein